MNFICTILKNFQNINFFLRILKYLTKQECLIKQVFKFARGYCKQLYVFFKDDGNNCLI